MRACTLLALSILVLLTPTTTALGQPPGGTTNMPTVAQQTVGQTPSGATVEQYTLINSAGLEAKVLTCGAMLTSVKVPDRSGAFDYVTLFHDDPAAYVQRPSVLGAVVGRFANRIAGARFVLDGKQVELAANAPSYQIHGGKTGFHTQVWKAEPLQTPDSAGVRLSLTSPDGHEGFPGALQVEVLYRLTDKNELWMEYTATTDKPTHLNLTNHAYWNLKGRGDVLDHRLALNAGSYLPTGEAKIPLGRIDPVAGTPMDFTEPHAIGSRIAQVDGENYDHCYVLSKTAGERLALAARVEEPTSGRVMEVYTTQPGVQLYTARGMKFTRGDRQFGSHPALCLETQHFPNSPNEPSFPTTVLRPGETFHEVTMHRFAIE